MNNLLYIVFLIWSIRILANIFSYIHLWYVKEYRLDRMLIHLRTDQGKHIYIPSFKLPPPTPKTILLFVFLILSSILLFVYLPFHPLIRLACIDIVMFPISACYVSIVQIPIYFYHMHCIHKAIKKIRSHAPMIVIGITGSYGKTSTKEFLSAILSSHYEVLKTEASKNSPIGIAEVILQSLRPDHKVFIVEMGAYKQGEIAFMTKMVQPQIGIITAINAQHQDLFGTIKTTQLAKYELIEGLQGKQIAIFNTDNSFVQDLIHWAQRDKKTIWLYAKNIRNTKKHCEMFSATHILSDATSLRFTVHYQYESYPVQVRIAGEHFVSNILAALAGAVAAGMTLEKAVAAARTIRPIPNVMHTTKGPKGEYVINDTFNNNPDAAIAALNFLRTCSGRKILVFQPMIELGSYANSSHEKVGEIAATICDEIIVTNNNFSEPFTKGIRRKHPHMIVHRMNADTAASFLHSILRKSDTVLFKGKEAELVLKKYIARNR